MTTREIRLPSGHVTLVDDRDWALVEPYHWRVDVNNQDPRLIHVAAAVKNPVAYGYTHVRMHRLIVGAAVGVLVDHANGDGLDNRRENLRLHTNAQSRIGSANTSGYKGVSWHKNRGLWQARASVGGINRHLGLFADPWEAAQAYNAAALATWGEFAFLNERLPQRVAS